MAFIVDEDRRIIDPDRHLQLTLTGSGTDGTHTFTLSGSDLDVSFWARRDVARIDGADPDLPAPLRTRVTWKVAGINPPPGWSREDTLEVVTEALAAFKYAHGGPQGQLVDVQFSNASAGM